MSGWIKAMADKDGKVGKMLMNDSVNAEDFITDILIIFERQTGRLSE